MPALEYVNSEVIEKKRLELVRMVTDKCVSALLRISRIVLRRLQRAFTFPN